MNRKQFDDNEIESYFNQIQASGLLSSDDYTFIAYDHDGLAERLTEVQDAFHTNFQHCVAIKSNPLKHVLKFIVNHGFGLEAATYQEVLLAKNAGAKKIVWDGPVKTISELEEASNFSELHVNANDLREFELINSLEGKYSVGLRINPSISTGSHSSMSVSNPFSKFGENIDNREAIVAAVSKSHDRVNTLHIHASSQTTDFSKLILAIQSVIEIAEEINTLSPGKIKLIDIGGGFPVSYASDKEFFMHDYANALKQIPQLFDGTFEVITEFGRYYHANEGVTFSKIDRVKSFENHQTITAHIGADSFLRECYNQGVWPHEFCILRNNKLLPSENLKATDIGGPLCFGGDYIQKSVALPSIEEGDWLAIKDTGANTFSLWSRHCSRPFPKVLIKESGSWFVGKEKETISDIINFWS